MVQFLQNFNLLKRGYIQSEVDFLFDDFECTFEVKSLMLDSVNSSKRTLTNFTSDDIVLVKGANSTNDKVLAIDAQSMLQRSDYKLFILERIFICSGFDATGSLRSWH